MADGQTLTVTDGTRLVSIWRRMASERFSICGVMAIERFAIWRMMAIERFSMYRLVAIERFSNCGVMAIERFSPSEGCRHEYSCKVRAHNYN